MLGLGLIGQLAARLAMATGCDVAGIDPAGLRGQPQPMPASWPWTSLGTRPRIRSSVGPAGGSGRRARVRRRQVARADVPGARPVPRPGRCGDGGRRGHADPPYPVLRAGDLTAVARSYGPGRYEPSYEAWGVDYPAGQVRWTEGRNQEAVSTCSPLAGSGCPT